MDIANREWVVEVDILYTLANRVTAISKLMSGTGRRGDFLYRPFDSPELNI